MKGCYFNGRTVEGGPAVPSSTLLCSSSCGHSFTHRPSSDCSIHEMIQPHDSALSPMQQAIIVNSDRAAESYEATSVVRPLRCIEATCSHFIRSRLAAPDAHITVLCGEIKVKVGCGRNEYCPRLSPQFSPVTILTCLNQPARKRITGELPAQYG
jgi:hypothetical protein